MVEFGSGYYMPMDREYGHHGHAHSHGSPAAGSTNDVGVGLGDFGMSLGLGPVPNVQAVKSKLYPGTKKLEFVFTGAGKGSGQGQTPEQYGLKQRQALAEISRANKVDFTTHATVGVYGLAGMDQQGNFSKTSKNMSIQEIKRAIEFAADVGQGGPVVVHTGEFHRPVVDAEWNTQGDAWQKKFQMYEDEEGRTSYRVVDRRGGNLLIEAKKNRKVSRPLWNRYEAENTEFWEAHGGQEYVDKNGNTVKQGEYIDPFGNKLDPAARVPRFNTKEQRFEVKEMGWDELKEEAKEMTKRAQDEFHKFQSMGLPLTELEKTEAFRKSLWRERIKRVMEKSGNEHDSELEVKPEEAYVIASLETTAANSRGWALYYGGNFEEQVDLLKKLKEARKIYQMIYESTDESERWKLQQLVGEKLGGLIPPETKYPVEIIDRTIRDAERHITQAQEAGASQWTQAADNEETLRYVESAERYAFREACDAYARAAIFAMRHSDKLQQEGKLKRPLAIAMENLFPETYGAHPDELIKLVKGSRDSMQKALEKEMRMNPEQAKKEANEHITATIDTGHLNMWRKYWKGDPSKSIKDNDEDFNKWSLQKLGEMIDADIVGHVHLDDNYGYHDDHLAPGEGNAPIKKMVEMLKEKKFPGSMIVEPGADYYTDLSGFHSVMKTWRLFGSPVYGGGSGISQKRSWNEVGYGHFGQNQPPYFVFGAYSPSEDWTLWSGVPLE